MTYAQDERLALCDLLASLGPDQPTLCEGWQTADLAAHLVLREHRPDAAAGMVGGPLAGYTRRAQAHLEQKTPFPRLIELIRTGPPRLSVFGLPGADERLNAVEFFVHHEDVRRAQPGWQPRPVDPGLASMLWDRLKMARFLLRKAPVGIELVRADDATAAEAAPEEASATGNSAHDGHAAAGNGRVRITAKARTPVVTVTGHPAELTMWAMGRTDAARVRMDGSDSDIAMLRAWRH